VLEENNSYINKLHKFFVERCSLKVLHLFCRGLSVKATAKYKLLDAVFVIFVGMKLKKLRGAFSLSQRSNFGKLLITVRKEVETVKNYEEKRVKG